MKKHDQNELTRRAVEARQAGMTYGKYMAMLYELRSLTGETEKPEEEAPEDEPKRRCAVCGKPLPDQNNRKQKYCSDECRLAADRMRQKLRKSAQNCNKED